MVPSRTLSLGALLTAATISLSGCGSSDSTDVQGNPDLPGNYTLVNITAQGQPTVGPPIATGTLNLTADTYTVSIVIAIPGQDPQPIDDTGTYTVSGNTWTQTSGTLNVQSVGTYSLTNGILTVDVSVSGQETVTVWQKQ